MSESDPVSVAIQQIRKVEPGMTLEYVHAQLNEDQQSVLAALRDNKTMSQAAESAGLHRTTPYTWLKSDPFFIAAYNAWKAEQHASNDHRLTIMEDAAVE